MRSMTLKKGIILLLAVSIAGFIAGYVLTNSVVFGICDGDSIECRGLLNRVGDPAYFGFAALSVVFALLIFVPKAFSAWMKFAIWYVPLVAILFAIAPTPGGGIGAAPSVVGPTPERIYLWGSVTYVVVSICIIVVQYIRYRRS